MHTACTLKIGKKFKSLRTFKTGKTYLLRVFFKLNAETHVTKTPFAGDFPKNAFVKSWKLHIVMCQISLCDLTNAFLGKIVNGRAIGSFF